MNPQVYPSDLSDKQWELLSDLFEQKEGPGRPRTVDIRSVVNGILYLTRTGCQWRYLPREYPAFRHVHYYFQKWQKDGTWEKQHDRLAAAVWEEEKPEGKQPSTASIDSQTSKSAGAQEKVGYDGGKKTTGRKRHIVVNSQGMILLAIVTSAALSDASVGRELLKRLAQTKYGSIQEVFGDSAYGKEGVPQELNSQGKKLSQIKRDPTKKGWQLLPKRWVVERTFGWFTRCRRLCRSYEHTAASELAFMRICMINVMTRRLCNITDEFSYKSAA